MKLKNRTIRENLATKYPDDVPSGNQIKNYVKILNKEKYGDTNISLGEMEAWMKLKNVVPEDEDESFIVEYFIDYETGHFKFLLSTKRLLLGALNTQFICADATYKLNWQGYPLLVVGNTDQDRHFHNVAV